MKRPFTEDIPKEILERIKSLNWYRHGIYRNNVMLSCSWIYGLGKEWFAKEGINKSLSNVIQINRPAFITEDEFEEISNLMLKKIQNEKDYLKNYIKKYRQDNENFLKVTEEIKQKDTSALSNKELAELFSLFIKESDVIAHWLWSMEFLNKSVDTFFKAKIKKWKPSWSEKQITEFLFSISHLQKKLPFQKEKEELLQINLKDEDAIKDMHKKYEWLDLYGWDGRPFTFEAYKMRITKIINDPKNKKEVEEFNKRGKEAYGIIQNIKEENVKDFLSTLRDLIYLKTERVDVYSLSWYNILNLIDEICKRLNISYEQYIMFGPDELIEFLQGKGISNDLDKRKNTACVRLNDQVYRFYGKAFDKIWEILNSKDYSGIKELKGTSAYKGVARGTARVLMTDLELSKLKKGDILVCNLTNPNYNPAFPIVSGVVTDEGGLLCHSAIMAREFLLPCVVGTKIATRVFKDGDLIEVDADKGIVKKLK